MKKKYIQYLFRLLIAVAGSFVYSSCERPVDLNLPPHDPRLVIHAYVSTGELFEVAIGKTLPSVGVIPVDTAIAIDNARVILLENGVRKDTLTFYSGVRVYRSADIKPISGNIYKIIVEAPGFPSVEAEATAPAEIPTSSVIRRKKIRVSEDGFLLDDVTFRFTDPASTQNYYSTELNTSPPFGNYNFCVYTYDPVVEQYQGDLSPFQGESCIRNTEVLFTDNSFNGVEKEITISSSSDGLADVHYDNRIYRPYLKKYNISKDFYTYIKDGVSVGLLQDNPFAQPFMIRGNVKNGYGLFTIFSTTTDTLR